MDTQPYIGHQAKVHMRLQVNTSPQGDPCPWVNTSTEEDIHLHLDTIPQVYT